MVNDVIKCVFLIFIFCFIKICIKLLLKVFVNLIIWVWFKIVGNIRLILFMSKNLMVLLFFGFFKNLRSEFVVWVDIVLVCLIIKILGLLINDVLENFCCKFMIWFFFMDWFFFEM